MNLQQHRELVKGLQAWLERRAGECERVETHISSVLLAGDSAWKLKKPLDLGFLDFSTLERRLHFCREEIRLNRRLEPDIYLDVQPVTGTPAEPRLGGEGDAIEYAVHMRRFDQDGLLSRHPALLTPQRVDRLALRLARFHAEIDRCGPDQPWGTAGKVLAPMLENFRQIRALRPGVDSATRLDPLEGWTRQRHRVLAPFIDRRRDAGHVRECHGDLHLGNIAVDGERLIIFDGIEFNPELRWIDTVSELAFLLMDLDEKRYPSLGWRLLNRYLELSGDYGGLRLLRFYQCYRAMVRAKVAAIGLQQGFSERLEQEFLDYLELAAGYTAPLQPALFITHGFSGSGKSTETDRLMAGLPAIRLRSDIERKRLAGLAGDERSGAAPDQGIYSVEFTRRTYARLLDLARDLLQAGFPVIVDATFLQRQQREPFYRLAGRLDVPCVILDFRVPEAELRRRVVARARRGGDASEADLTILERQLASAVPLADGEREMAWETAHPHRLDVDGLREYLSGLRREAGWTPG
ncbi:MAG TPA: hypothetical protein ENI96_06370 [Sedimenticola thiotaurini]|uniref:Aminoglycoside phosphotransferase domain-containing protein n=1 Tax=Sedimenticola thiotaurini TaxID=1543721 RepID=A0A831W737_9GAMM|nr:hypothetical protein [Sedimenticola thiotaurini]